MCEEGLRRVFEENNLEFFSYAWREHLQNVLTAESKFSQLIDWINERLNVEFALINCFNPADKDSTYSKANMKDYLEACQTVAVLLNAKCIIMSDTCTTKMRENWEYAICKLYHIHYVRDIGYAPNMQAKDGKK